MNSIYEIAVMNVKKAFPHAQDTRVSSREARFRTVLKRCLLDQYAVQNCKLAEDVMAEFEDLWETMLKPRFIPDLWWVDQTGSTVHIYEIEDTHPLTKDKLVRLHNYWWDLDSVAWSLTVTVFDRYGLNQRELDLDDYAMHIIAATKTDRNS